MVAAVSSIPLLARVRWAWAYTFILVCVPFFSTGPYATIFLSGFLVAGLLAVQRFRMGCTQAAVSAYVACLVGAMCRAEFSQGVYASAIVSGIFLLHRLRQQEKSSFAVMTGIVAVCVLVMVATLSLSNSLSRSGVALAQHFNVRAVQAGLLHQDPWTSNYAELQFGVDGQHHASDSTVGIGAFLRANPKLFLSHVLRNLRDPATVLATLVVALLVAAPWLGQQWHALRPVALYAALVSLPTIASMAVIYPRNHYIATLVPVCVALLLMLARPTHIPPPWIVVPIALLAILGAALIRNRHPPEFDTNDRASLAAVRCMQSAERVTGPGNGRVLNLALPPDADTFFHFRAVRVRADESPAPSWLLAPPAAPPPPGYTAFPCATGGLVIYRKGTAWPSN